MDYKYELFRIYVWHYERDNSWVAEGKWWKENKFGDRNLQGTICDAYFRHESLTEAIDEVLQTAKDFGIKVKEDIRLSYSEKYEYWDEEDYGEPNPFPKPENFEEIIEKEREKRKWKS
jgi:hypothetical protein